MFRPQRKPPGDIQCGKLLAGILALRRLEAGIPNLPLRVDMAVGQVLKGFGKFRRKRLPASDGAGSIGLPRLAPFYSCV